MHRYDDSCDAFHTFDPTASQATVNMVVVDKLMALIETSLASKLDAIETLIGKNKQNLAKASHDFKKIEDIVTTYQKSNKSQCLSDEIRLLFALARNDRLDLVGKVANIDQAKKASQRTPAPSRSRSPIADPFSTAKKSQPFGNNTELKMRTSRTPVKPSEPKRYDKQNAIQKSPILNRVLSGATSELIKESVSRLYQPKPRQEIDVATSKLTSERNKKKSLVVTNTPAILRGQENSRTNIDRKLSNKSSRARLSPSPSYAAQGHKQAVKIPGGGGTNRFQAQPVSPKGIKEVDSRLETTQENSKAPVFNLNLPSPVNAKLFQVETQGIFSVKDTSAYPRTTRLDELDFDERMVPRTSPRVRPVDHPTFDEPSTSHVPSQLMTPNNMSSFIEMLNYNSDTENDPNEHGKSTLTLTPQAGLRGDTTQDFIKEALADFRTTVDKHTKPLHDAGSRQKAMGQSERLARRGTTQMFSNIDDDMKLHERCAFAGLNFLRPIKHSARMVLPDPPVNLKLGGLRPLVDAAKPGNCVLAS